MRKLWFSFIGVVFLCVVVFFGLSAVGVASARTTRDSYGSTGKHTHVTWGAGVGLIAWTVGADFSSLTPCGSHVANVTVDASWNSASLHNGAELDIIFSAQRSDGRYFQLGNTLTITKAQPWPGHPAFGGRFQASVPTPAGMYLKKATVTSWIGGLYIGGAHDTIRLKQLTKKC